MSTHLFEHRAAPASATDAERYEALLRISETLSTCREPEELSRILADQLRELLPLDYLDVLIFKEDSDEVEWHAKGNRDIPCFDVPIEETHGWRVYRTQEPLYIADWGADVRFPALKQLLERQGFRVGSVVRVPLTTAHRRLGTLGIASVDPNAYLPDDVTFLQLLGRQVALAIDDALNARQSRGAQVEMERQNDRLKLLLDLANRITSNLDLSEVLRAIAASVREMMHCDAVGVSLPDSESGKFRLYAVDFPQSEGFVREKSGGSLDKGPGAKALDSQAGHPKPHRSRRCESWGICHPQRRRIEVSLLHSAGESGTCSWHFRSCPKGGKRVHRR